MKTNKLYKNNFKKIFELKLIKNKVYNKNYLNIKKNLKIIYKFHTKNKKILFLGINKKVNFFVKLLKKKPNHTYITNNIWLNGILSNSAVFKHLCLLKKKNLFTFLFNFKSQKYNLIVIFSEFYNNELIKYNNVPIIFLNNNFNNISYCYKLELLKLIKTGNDIIYFLIYNIIKKFKK